VIEGIAIAVISVASGLVLHNGARHAAGINAALKAGSTIEIVNALTGCAGRQPGEQLRKIP
jgi:hypothetical protein